MSRIAESYHKSIFNILKNCQTYFTLPLVIYASSQFFHIPQDVRHILTYYHMKQFNKGKFHTNLKFRVYFLKVNLSLINFSRMKKGRKSSI